MSARRASSRNTSEDSAGDSSEPRASSPVNYISNGMGYCTNFFQPASERWARLNTKQRYIAGVIAAPLIVLPAVWLLFVLPPLILLFALLYTLCFGFGTFVTHLEDGLRHHFSVSDEVHENADKLKHRAERVSSRVWVNVMDIFSLTFYTVIMYAMKALEFVIAKLQSAMGTLKRQEAKVKRAAPKRD